MRTLIPALALAAAVLTPGPAEAQDRLLAAPLGAGVGLAAGGYLTLAVIVGQARLGHYVLEVEEIIGWRSAPVLIGAGLGAALGYLDPQRLLRTALAGSAGTAIGAGAGILLGTALWEDSEGRWAGGVLGAGAGMVVGSLIGILWRDGDNGGGAGDAAALLIPLFEVRLP